MYAARASSPFSGVSPFNWGLTEVEDDDESKPPDRENKRGGGTNYPILNGIIRVSLPIAPPE